MSDNTTLTPAGAEIYEHEIYRLCDEFIESELSGDVGAVKESFPSMILYIADRIDKPSHDDIELLDSIFDIFVRMCAKYKVLPTLEAFSWLIKTNRATFSDWRNKEYRNLSNAHSNAVQKWFDTCKAFTVNHLHNAPGASVNLIFIAKSAYGLVETAPAPAEPPRQRVLTAAELPRLADLPGEEENNERTD